MRRKLLIIALIAIVAGGGFFYFFLNRSDTSTAAEIPGMMTVPVTRQSLTRTVSASGRLEPNQDVPVYFDTGGTVTEIGVKVGEWVESGTVLGRVDPRDAQIELIRAQREYDQARFEATPSVKEEKRLSLELAQRRSEGTMAVAPFDGLVVEAEYSVGDSAAAQSVAFRMIDTSSYRIVVDIDQLDLRHVRTGQDVIVHVDAFPELRLVGKVTNIGWLPTSAGGVVSYPVEVTVSSAQTADGNGSQPPSEASFESLGIRPGLTVQVDIVVAAVEDALVVPLAAVVEDGNTAYVTRVKADGSEEVVPITTGMSDVMWIEVREGLREGDQVLMNNYELYSRITSRGQGGAPASAARSGFGSPLGGTIRMRR